MTAPGTSRRLVGAALLPLLGAIFYVDFATGFETRLYPFYFLPVALASWNFGRRCGLGVAFLSGAGWAAADVMTGHEYSAVFPQVWNAAIQLLTFSLTAILLAVIAKSLRAERTLNDRLEEAMGRAESLHGVLIAEHERLERLHGVVARDLEMASAVQQAMLPRSVKELPGLDVAYSYRPALSVGGDVVIASTRPDHGIALFVGDVMGHGTRAALVGAAVNAIVRRSMQLNTSPSEILRDLNLTLIDDFPGEYVTGVCAFVDSDVRRAVVSVAGHPRPLLVRLPAAPAEIGETELLLGFMRRVRYVDVSVPLEPADLLVFFTDGVTDARGDAGRFETRRLRDTLAGGGRSADVVVARMLTTLAEFSGTEPLDDDATVLVARVPVS